MRPVIQELKEFPSNVSGDNYQNCAKLLIRHRFVTFLLLYVLRPICCVQPCQGEDFKKFKIYYSGSEGVVVSIQGVVDRNCRIGVVFTVLYKL